MNKVHIVIVNFNNFQDTIECLESLLKSDYLNFQIFVVDNSVNDLSMMQFSIWVNNNNYTEIKTGFSHLIFPLQDKPLSYRMFPAIEFSNADEIFEERIIFIKAKNNGFAAANNIALRYILKKSDDYGLIWILNNDTVVEKDTLRNLVTCYCENINNKYVFGSKIKYYKKPHVIQAVGGRYNKWLGKHYHIGDGEEDNGQYDGYKFGKLDYIVGASIFLSKLFVDQVGLMCEDYFLYFEELDWMRKGARHGFSLALVPNAIVYHKEGASIIGPNEHHKDTSVAEYYSITNRVRFIKKWYPICLITVLSGVSWALLRRLFLGKFQLVKKTSVSIFKILFFGN